MEPLRFGIIGGAGWRAEFFLRIARELPERFAVSGMVVRDAEKGEATEARWRVPTFRTLDALLGTRPAFVVVSVPWSATPTLLRELDARSIPALAETPPAPDLGGLIALTDLMRRGARIQVAEQYAFQPLHAARLALVRSGRLGPVSQAQVSAAHGYHGVSLLRKFLGVTFENAAITAHAFKTPLVAGPDRNGPPAQETVSDSAQTIAYLDFGGKVGVFDFTGAQYFSWVRSPRLLVRGERGEINNAEVRWLEDFRTPVTVSLRREDAGQEGNLEGYYHKGILAGAEWVYRNPFAPGRLADDEIAVATCLQKMGEYAGGGPDFYRLAEAAQDHYLGMAIDQAAKTGETLRTETQPWAEAAVEETRA